MNSPLQDCRCLLGRWTPVRWIDGSNSMCGRRQRNSFPRLPMHVFRFSIHAVVWTQSRQRGHHVTSTSDELSVQGCAARFLGSGLRPGRSMCAKYCQHWDQKPQDKRDNPGHSRDWGNACWHNNHKNVVFRPLSEMGGSTHVCHVPSLSLMLDQFVAIAIKVPTT